MLCDAGLSRMRFLTWHVSPKPLRTPRSSKPINPRCLFPNVPSGPKTSDESRGISGLWMLFFGGVHIGVRSQNIGVQFRDGLGVSVNYAEAMRWFRRAAGEGDYTSANAVGVLYQQGLGVSVDYAESMRWYLKAAEAGYDTAMYNIGVLWEGGLGTTQNRDQAITWYRKASAIGNERAKAALKSLGVKD